MCYLVCAFILCTLRDNSLTLHWFKRSDQYLSGSGVGEQNRTSATPVSEDCWYAALSPDSGTFTERCLAQDTIP